MMGFKQSRAQMFLAHFRPSPLLNINLAYSSVFGLIDTDSLENFQKKVVKDLLALSVRVL